MAVGDDGTHAGEAVIVDTCATYERTRRFLDAVRTASGAAPITMAVNTHQHGDHTYGNSVLPPETVIIGHTVWNSAYAILIVWQGGWIFALGALLLGFVCLHELFRMYDHARPVRLAGFLGLVLEH